MPLSGKLEKLTQGSNNQSSRRHFLKTTLSLPLAAAPAVMTQSASAGDAPASAATAALLPRRHRHCLVHGHPLFRLGGLDCYLGGKSEKIFGAWLAKYPERRKEIFFVSKDYPRRGPGQMLEMIDRRLDACGTTKTRPEWLPASLPKSPETMRTIRPLPASIARWAGRADRPVPPPHNRIRPVPAGPLPATGGKPSGPVPGRRNCGDT